MLSVSLLEILATVWGYSLFGIGSLVIIILLPARRLIPFNDVKKKELLHAGICYFFRFLLRSCPVLKINLINPGQDNFLKPAIVIGNHQSMLDILIFLALAPKTIIITRSWVWGNPILGRVARYADFYCADDGYESLTGKLKDKLAQGYSIIIFPESKRSYTGDIDRFHKGAFYLAQQLKADILPVIIHGTINSVPRGSRLIKKSRIILKYLPRISALDNSFGDNYTDRSKNIRHYMIGEYEKI